MAGITITKSLHTITLSDINLDWAWNQGPELVTNGDFDDWTGDDPDSFTVIEAGATADVTESASKCQMIGAVGEPCSIVQAIASLDAGKFYYVRTKISTDTSGAFILGIGVDSTVATAEAKHSVSLDSVGSTTAILSPNPGETAQVSLINVAGAANMVFDHLSVTLRDDSLYPGGMPIQSIEFTPHATADKCIIRDGGVEDGAICFDPICANVYDQKIKYFYGRRLKPFLDLSASTIGANGRVIITLAE